MYTILATYERIFLNTFWIDVYFCQYIIVLTGQWAKYRRQNIPWPTKKYLDNWQTNYQWNEVLPAEESNGR